MMLYRPRFRYLTRPQSRPTWPRRRSCCRSSIRWPPTKPTSRSMSRPCRAGCRQLMTPPCCGNWARGAGEGHSLTLLRSERAMTDCLPISLFSLQTARQLGEEVGTALDKRRFRANSCLDLTPGGFSESTLVDHKGAHWSQSRGRRSRARPALPNDHARSRYGDTEPGSLAQGGARSRWRVRGIWRRAVGGNDPGR